MHTLGSVYFVSYVEVKTVCKKTYAWPREFYLYETQRKSQGASLTTLNPNTNASSIVRFLHTSKLSISPQVQPTRWYGPHKLNDITCATFMVNSSSMEYTPSRLHTPMAYCLPSRKNITPMGSLLSSSTLMLFSFVTDKIDLISARWRSSNTFRIFALVGQ